MKIPKTILVCLAVGIAAQGMSFAQYVEPNSYKNPQRTRTVSPGSGDDTNRIQDAINYVTVQGGRVNLRAGTYQARGLVLKKNVHLVVPSGVTFELANHGSEDSTLFGVVDTRDASIRGTGGKFTVKLPNNGNGARAVFMRDATNILLSGFKIDDRHLTKFPAVEYTFSSAGSGLKNSVDRVTLIDSEALHESYG